MAELKLRRLNELVTRLREDLDRRRIPVSEAANEYALWPALSRPLQCSLTSCPQSDQLHRQGTERLHGALEMGICIYLSSPHFGMEPLANLF